MAYELKDFEEPLKKMLSKARIADIEAIQICLNSLDVLLIGGYITESERGKIIKRIKAKAEKQGWILKENA